MRTRFSAAVLVLVTASLLILTGCGGETSALDVGPASLQPLSESSRGWPDLSELLYAPAEDQSEHGTSSDYSLTRLGDAELLHSQNTVEDAVAHTQLLVSGISDPAWAIYRFTGLADADTPQNLTIELVTPLPDSYWVGFADYASQRWLWQKVTGVAASTILPVPVGAQLITPTGYVYAAVVTDNDVASLVSLTLTAEQSDTSPLAKIMVDSDRGNAALHVAFDGGDSTDRDAGTIDLYEWDFEADGVWDSSGASQYASHTYTGLGTYHPLLRVTDNDGHQDTAAGNIYVQGWTHTWGTSANEIVHEMASDPNGNVYAVGYTTLNGYYNDDLLVVKYDRYGAPLWQRGWGGDFHDKAFAAACDNQGNLYVAGGTASAADYSSCRFVVLLKFNPVGALVWEKTWHVDSNESGYAINVDRDGNILLAATMNATSGGSDVVLLKYSPSGNLLWQKVWEAYGMEYPAGIAFDLNGNIFICGNTNGTNSDSKDAFLLKLTPDGNYVWHEVWGTDGTDSGEGVVLDLLGNAYVAGGIHGENSVEGSTMLVKFDADGTRVWAKHWETNRANWGSDIVSTGGFLTPLNLWLTGSYYDAVDTDSTHIALLNFNNAGTLNSQKTWVSSADQSARGSCMGKDGALHIAGDGENASGTWINGTGTVADAPVVDYIWTGSLKSVTGIDGTWNGTLTDLTGVIDSGGGLSDALVMGWYAEDL